MRSYENMGVRCGIIVRVASLLLFACMCFVLTHRYVYTEMGEGARKMQKPMDLRTNSAAEHKSVNCCALLDGRSLEVMCDQVGGTPNTGVPCTCIDYLYCRLAVVAAISSNHFEEIKDMIHSVQLNIPNTKIFVYDLGLTKHQKINLSEYCHVEVRTFPFSKYPSHFKDLALNEAWKPVIINELSTEYDVIMYGDASMRMLKPAKDNVLPHLLEFPFVPAPATHSHPVISVTPPEMYKYLGLNLTRQLAVKAMPVTIQSTMMLIWVTKLMKEKFLNNWVDCAMHKECMSPKGYKRYTTCNFGMLKQKNYGGNYIGCMRCQSIVNIILYREFGAQVWKKVQHFKLDNKVWQIERYPTHQFNGSMCPAAEM